MDRRAVVKASLITALDGKTLFTEGELEEKAVVAYFATTALDGKTYNVSHHLEAVLVVGYRVRSPCGTQFRSKSS